VGEVALGFAGWQCVHGQRAGRLDLQRPRVYHLILRKIYIRVGIELMHKEMNSK
jgi:hypothetical protein